MSGVLSGGRRMDCANSKGQFLISARSCWLSPKPRPRRRRTFKKAPVCPPSDAFGMELQREWVINRHSCGASPWVPAGFRRLPCRAAVLFPPLLGTRRSLHYLLLHLDLSSYYDPPQLSPLQPQRSPPWPSNLSGTFPPWALCICCSPAWNTFPSGICMAHSLPSFRSWLKCHFSQRGLCCLFYLKFHYLPIPPIFLPCFHFPLRPYIFLLLILFVYGLALSQWGWIFLGGGGYFCIPEPSSSW